MLRSARRSQPHRATGTGARSAALRASRWARMITQRDISRDARNNRPLRHGTGMRPASHWLLAGMRIAVIGKGNIGGTLGSKWRAAGHDVVYGARDGSGQGPGGAPVRSIGDALEDAGVVLLAVPGQAVPDVVNEQGAALAGKVVIDAVNRMGAPEFDSRALIADAAPSARYVRAFNSLGWENFADPLPGTNLFFAADPEARAAAEELISAVGLEPAFVGDATATATVDGLLPLWFALVRQNGGNRKVALRIVR
jgi:8-hydroxy-5-deazaflavin:NADPH oxidoreductase